MVAKTVGGNDELTAALAEGIFAFPVVIPTAQGAVCDRGMTLRDWFAGQALAGLMADPNISRDRALRTAANPPAVFASAAYAVADALLAERER